MAENDKSIGFALVTNLDLTTRQVPLEPGEQYIDLGLRISSQRLISFDPGVRVIKQKFTQFPDLIIIKPGRFPGVKTGFPRTGCEIRYMGFNGHEVTIRPK